MRIIAEIFGHLSRQLNTKGEHVNPIIFIRTQTVISISMRVYFLSVLAKPSEANSDSFGSILISNFYDCRGIPHSIEGID